MHCNENLSNLVSEIVNEGKSGHGDLKEIYKMIKNAISEGLVDTKETKNGIMIKSLKDTSQLLLHPGERGIHDLRRYLNKLRSLP